MKKIFMLFVLLSGCATTLGERRAANGIPMSKEEPKGCMYISAIERSGPTYDDAFVRLRLEAAAVGGNYLVLDSYNTDHRYYGFAFARGRAFSCPQQISAN